MRVSKRLIRLGWVVLSALLVLFCGASVVQAVTAVSGRTPDAPDIGVPNDPTRPTQHAAAMYAALENSPIFIQAAETPPPPGPPVETEVDDVPITDLDLILVGVVRNEDGSGLAVILNKRSRTQGTFAVGEEVLPNVSVTRIGATKVVLNNKGKSEALEMLLEGEEGSSRPSTSIAGRPPLPTRGESRETQQATAIRRINDNLRVVSRDAFEREYGANAVNVITSAATEPRYVGDQPSGLILRDLGRGNLMTDLGFQRDDVIVAVQGRRTNAPQDLEAIGEFLNTASDVRVQIVRDNLPRTLIFKVR